MVANLLEVANLKVCYPASASLGAGRGDLVTALDGVSLSVDAGEALGVVGESGSGKSTLARAILGLVAPAAGSIRVGGMEIAGANAETLRKLRRQVQMVFQDPYGSLDPRMRVADIVGEAIDIHGLAKSDDDRSQRVQQALTAVGLDRLSGGKYPHQFSGGQRQRIGIARALAVEPRLLVCDEPVSALDVSVQAQIVNLLLDLKASRSLALLFVAHDLAVVSRLCERVAVLYLGQIVEMGTTEAVLERPQHPYTQALVAAMPVMGSGFSVET
jgi:ABC-type oligopeptide transport system ATPase subunit